MATAEESVVVAIVSSAAAKGVKDTLKARGWLDQKRKVGVAGDGKLAFPLSSGAEEALRAALASDEATELGAIIEVRAIDAASLASKKPPPQQKAPKAATSAAPAPKPRPAAQERSFGGGRGGQTHPGGSLLPPADSVRRVECPPEANAEWLRTHVFSRREPAVLSGLALGPCHGGWTAERLAAARCTAVAVSVHVCSSPTVDLAGHRTPNTPRNFVFKTMPFAEAVRRCARASQDKAARASVAAAAEGSDEASPLPPLLQPGERYYLRSVGLDPRKDTADFPSLFPELATEAWLLPHAAAATDAAAGAAAERRPLLDGAAYHSSVLRLASDDTQLWTHFDVMDNALAQLTGHKRVVLWPPSCDADLYVEGSSSRVAHIDTWNDDEFPRFRRAVGRRREAQLAPGDVLFIPALWFHNVTSIGFSVALNVFWRSHHPATAADTAVDGAVVAAGNRAAASSLYDAKDLYGNRDPPAASLALDHAAAAATQLAKLPEPFRSFYARRAARQLMALAEGCDDIAHANGDGDGHADATKDNRRVAGTRVAGMPGGPRVQLSSGASMPLLGLGTWEAPAAEVGAAVRAALAAGVRHFDCASCYRNEAAVGAVLAEALQSGQISRAELFVTSKLWNSDHGRVAEALAASLRALRLDRLDLYLVHWPCASAAEMRRTWRQMEAQVAAGRVTSIGVANCSAAKLGALLGCGGEVQDEGGLEGEGDGEGSDRAPLAICPAVNQVEAHPGWRNAALLSYCATHGVHVTAYSPLGRGDAASSDGGATSLLRQPLVCEVATALGCTPAQALLRWACVHRRTSAIPKSVSPARILENASAILAPIPAAAAGADDQAALLTRLDGLMPQVRRVDGAYFVAGKAGQRHSFSSLAELWDE